MLKDMARFATLLAAVVAQGIGVARADVRELVEAGKITWTGTPAVIYLNADGTTADASAYEHLVLKFTKTGDAGALTLADGIKGQARVLVVGGGGAGGTSTDIANSGAGGGGGAGGFIETSIVFDGNGEQTFNAVVGAGGVVSGSLDTAVGGDGESSSFGDIVALGGGGGGAQSVGGNGGSGGGGSFGTAACNGGTAESSQGKNGGRGAAKKFAAGGGGAGAAGGASTTATPGAGGKGIASDIILNENGVEITYAGGGGGGSGSAIKGNAGKGGGGIGAVKDASEAGNGTDGLGGGGGGGSNACSGGRGGSGIVIVRITEAREITLDVPTISDIVYTGNNIVPFDFGIAYVYVSGMTNATNVGTYTFDVKPNEAEGFSWKTGGAEAKTVTWKIAKRVIVQPTVAENLVYTGESQTGVEFSDDILQFCDYAEGGETNAVNAGEHTFTLSLKDKVNTTWITSTSTLTTDDFFGFWYIAPVKVAQPVAKTGLKYTGEAQNAFDELDYERYELTEGETNAVAGGTHTFTFALLGNEEAQNYVWDVDPATAEPYTGEWTIATAANAITKFELKGWKIGLPPNDPVLEATYGAETAKISYGFGSIESAVTQWIDDPTQIDTAGTWIARAVIEATDSWGAAKEVALFDMWDDPSMIYHDYVEFNLPGIGTEVADIPVPLTISPDRIPGFTYERAGNNCEGFVFIDEIGNILRYDIDELNTAGDTILWLKLKTLPADGIKVTMYWNLREGKSAPEDAKFVPKEVWSDYVGVWHLGETATAANAASVYSKDSVNGNNAKPTKGSNASADLSQMISIPGVVGNGRVNSSVTSVQQGNRLQTTTAMRLDTFGGSPDVFTFTGWFRMNARGQWPRLVGNKSGGNDKNGWSVETASNSSTSFKVRGNGGSNGDVNGIDDLLNNWVYLAFVYSNNTASVYSNGRLAGTVTITPVINVTQPLSFGAHGDGVEWSLNGSYDELRISPKILPQERIAAEREVMTNAVNVSNGHMYHDGLKANKWIVYPELDKTEWDVNGEKGTFISEGETLYGEVTHVIYSVYDTTKTFDSPADITEAGLYRIDFTTTEVEDTESLEYSIDIRVIESQPYTKIGGTNGDSGRVLLMNRDTNTKCPIQNQGYDIVAKGNSTFWEILDKDTIDNYNLQSGTSSILWIKNYSDRLWHLVDCRHGNSYPKFGKINNKNVDGVKDVNGVIIPATAKNPVDLDSIQNYLPYSSTSWSFLKSALNKANASTAGQIVMRNVENATVYSSCFTNGIGTIYFDAVNGWCRGDEIYENYKIVVEICTNTVEGLEPRDINSFTRTVTTNEVDGTETVTTNFYGNLEGQWHQVDVIPFLRNGTDDFVKQDATNEVALAVNNGGTMDNFYRIVVPLDILGPVRFRIRRTTYDALRLADASSLILLDNIIASLPAMRGDLYSAGHFEEEKTGHEILGWELATNVPYPSKNDAEIIPNAKPEYYVNAGGGAEVDTSTFISDAKMHYRWRYLNHEIGEWKAVDLNPGDDFKAISALDLPGRACDVEYWFEYNLQSPFYSYVDYSGLGKAFDYTEARGTLTNSLASASVMTSGGTNWFFRVREGLSDYAKLDIKFMREGSEIVESVPMSLIRDHMWYGFVQTKEDQKGLLRYRIEARDRETRPYADYQPSTNRWCCATEDPKFPVSDKLDVDAAEDQWSTVTLDAVTGYVMFMVDDSTRSLTIVHADYQDFNGWTDAHDRKDSRGRTIFVGTSTTNQYKIGVSPTKQTFEEDFGTWQTMPATNEYWKVPTYSDINHLYGHSAYETFQSDTNSLWAIGQGMWVSKKYKNDKDNSGVAIQMEGNGKGYLQFTDSSAAPRGIESVSFNARLGQFIRFEDFAYYYGDVIMNLSNYTFMVRAAYDLKKNAGFDGNASLSLVANYLPNKGCYEARWEWIGTELTKAPSENKGQRLALYRWNVSAGGKKTATLIGAWTNSVKNQNFTMPQVTALANNSSNLYMPFFISVSNSVDHTWVIAGVRRGGYSLGTTSADFVAADNWAGVAYCDNDSKNRLKRGTYGVLSANCDGVFARPQISSTVTSSVKVNPGVGKFMTYHSQTTTDLGIRSMADVTYCSERDVFGDEDTPWNLIPGRMTSVRTDSVVNAIQSSVEGQKLEIYLGTAGRADWSASPYWTTNLTSFGGKAFTVPLYTTKDCSVKFKVAGEVDDVRTDVVLHSVEMRQFRGGDWNDDNPVNGVSKYLPDWALPGNRSNINGFSNFVFTSCWVINNDVLMSAKRSNLETPCAIRAPLMDGYVRNGRGGDGTSRGKGLGMISVEYANAQPNAVLQLQIATNQVNDTTIDAYDKLFGDPWITWTNFNFSAMTPLQRQSGVLNAYIGLHDVEAAMRIVVSTNAVMAVQNVKDTSMFGEVTIKRIVCRDEPAVDVHSWWGWNIRTEGGDEDSKGRMYLPDFASSAGDAGLSLAINSSVDETDSTSEIDVNDRESYLPHKPFVQTPTFTSNVVGEVSFKARKYASEDGDAALVLLGSTDASETDDGTWKRLEGAVFYVTNSYYETYTYKTDPGQEYKAFRLAVSGVPGVTEGPAGGGNAMPEGVRRPLRVLVDEMYVSEAVRARMGFRNVGCFKSDIAGTAEVPGVPGRLEQPLCNEAWGVQCEVYGAQLADDIDFSRKPRVRLHWFEGVIPWGYENWKNDARCHSAWLSQATGTDEDKFVYRTSQRTSPEAVVPMSTFSPTYVQYMLEVVYYTKGASVPTTNFLAKADWGADGKGPEWYSPLDLNAEYGMGRSFSAYNILDSVAPGWAWINEVNVFGEFDSFLRNSDRDMQYVEIAQPPESDISGWKLNFLEMQKDNDLVVTNTLATFGSNGLKGTKDSQWIDAEANMVFRVIGNKQARDSGRLKFADGTFDGLMYLTDSHAIAISGDSTGEVTIDATRPFALQLVRKSGIVEHEIVSMGTNWWSDLPPSFVAAYSPTNTVNFLNEKMSGARFFYLGMDDDGGEPKSLGVFQNSGLSTNDWNNTMDRTPGRRNAGQYIDPDHPVPSGESVLVYFTVSGDHIQQWNGDVFTNMLYMTSVTKGSQRGTNITYRVDPWYVVGSVTTNGVSAMGDLARTKATMPYEFTLEGVGKGASNNVTVVARAEPDPRLASEWGVGPDNVFREAILDWLLTGTDLYGNPFEDVESGEVKLAKFRSLNGTYVGDMTLTEMYWFDMDPTAGDLALVGGMAGAPEQHLVTKGDGGTWTNLRMKVSMMITNESDTVVARAYPRGANDFGTHWTPYALRGVEPQSNSLGYEPTEVDWNAKSPTFKMTGLMMNGKTIASNPDYWMPLRWFVFREDSFSPEGISNVEVRDPHRPGSVGWNTGWGKTWAEEAAEGKPLTGLGWFWSVDTRTVPVTIEALTQEKYYDDNDN